MILERILAHKRREIEPLTRPRALARLERAAAALPRASHALRSALSRSKRRPAVIAEIKRRSPSKGLLRKDFRPVEIARAYRRAGAEALSVLTDRRFFGGSAAVLRRVRAAVRLPILRKDFILHEAQVYESRLLGADAILLIARALTRERLARLSALAERLGLDVLFEVHDRADLRKVLPLKPKLLGINNRNLRTFRVDLGTTARIVRLLGRANRPLIVSESGVTGPRDAKLLVRAGARAVLVGESLMKSRDVADALRRLRAGGR